MHIKTIDGNPLPGYFFDKDFDEALGWLHQIKDIIHQYTELKIEVVDKFVFHKHLAMLCKLDTELTPATIINILTKQVKSYPGGYRPWFTYDHYCKELMIVAYPFYKGKLMEEQVQHGY